MIIKTWARQSDSNFIFNKGLVSTICTLVVTEGGTQIYQSLSQGTFSLVDHCLRNAGMVATVSIGLNDLTLSHGKSMV